MGKISVAKIVFIGVFLYSDLVMSLDFDREINRNRHQVKVRYTPGQRSPASFYTNFTECRKLRGSKQVECNRAWARASYRAYNARQAGKGNATRAAEQAGSGNGAIGLSLVQKRPKSSQVKTQNSIALSR